LHQGWGALFQTAGAPPPHLLPQMRSGMCGVTDRYEKPSQFAPIPSSFIIAIISTACQAARMQRNFDDLRQTALAAGLRACQLFSSLAVEDLASIAAFVVQKRLEKGDYLFREGEKADGFYVLQRGAVNVHRVSATGKEQVIHVFRAGESFAEAVIATGTGYPADARAVEPTLVLLVPKTDFLGLLRDKPDLALRMLASMSQHLRVLVGMLEDLTLKDVETRLVNWLLKHCPRPRRAAVSFDLDRTKRVLAAELGTVSETLSRSLAKLRERKLIRVKGSNITVLQPLELEQMLRRNLGEE
jgi:CRP/FNR family transcriptional regulator